MAKRAMQPCLHPGCLEVVRPGERYCGTHRREITKAYDRQRGSAAARGYDARWRRLRKQVLSEEPLCRACLAEGRLMPSTDVDHIVPKSQGGTDDRSNLQGLCHKCHSRKTAREDGRWG